MQKWIGLIVLGWFVFGGQARALFIDAEGHYALNGEYANFRSLNKVRPEKYDILRHRLWLDFNFKITDKLSFKTAMSNLYHAGSDYLGDGGKSIYTPQANRSPFSNELPLASVYFNRFWVAYMSDFGIWIIGRAPKHFGMGNIFNRGDDIKDFVHDTTDRIAYKNIIGSLTFNFGYEKLQETGTCAGCGATAGGDTRSDDMYGFFIDLNYHPDQRDLSFFWEKVIRQNDRTVLDYFLFSGNLDFQKLKINSEFDIIDGKTSDGIVIDSMGGKKDVRNKVSGFAALMSIAYTFLPKHSALLTGGYSGGDEDLFKKSADRDSVISTLPLHPNQKPALLMFNSPVEYLKPFHPLYTDRVFNAYFGKATYQYSADDVGTFSANIIGGRMVEVNKNKDALGAQPNLGLEIDLVFSKNFTDHVGFNVGGGFLFAGDAYQAKDNAKEHGYMLESTVRFLF